MDDMDRRAKGYEVWRIIIITARRVSHTRVGCCLHHQQNRDPGSSQLGVLASRSQLELGTEIAAYSPSWPRASFG